MPTYRFLIPALIVSLAAAACQPMPGAMAPAGLRAKAKAAATEPRNADEPASPEAPAATPTPGQTAPAVPRGTYFGRVVGLDGRAAAGVLVRGHLLSNNGGSLIGKVKTPAGIISSNGSNLIGKVKGAEGYRLLSTSLETRTDAEGRFELKSPDGAPLNLEAVESDEIKAIAFGVPEDAEGVTLQLAPTGRLTGQVTAPEAPSVTNFEGVDVFIPGTGYMAKADAAGRFSIENLPAGIFELVASKRGLGTARAQDVEIKSKETTTVAALALSASAPRITAVEPPNGAVGTLVTLKGEHFGASVGEVFHVSVGGVLASSVERVDDRTLRVTVPDGAPSGEIVVNVGGIPSTPAAFTVIKTLRMAPSLSAILRGSTHPLTAVAFDAADQRIENPAVQWTASGSAIAVDAAGVLTAKALGTGTLTLASGSLKQTYELTVANVVADVSAGPYAPDPGGVATGPAGLLHFMDRGLLVYAKRREADDTTTSLAGGSAEPMFGDAVFRDPGGLAVASDGTVYVADTGHHRIRKIAPDQSVTTLAGSFTKNTFSGTTYYFGGYADGAGTAAKFNSPTDVALSADGATLYVADRGNHAVRAIALPSGEVTTLAGTGAKGYQDAVATAAAFASPYGLTVDGAGAVFVADRDNHRIRRIAPDKTVTTVAGASTAGALVGGYKDGAALTAEFDGPLDVAVDAAGRLYVADDGSRRVRMIAADGMVSTLAGNGQSGVGEILVNGPGLQAKLNGARNLVVDAAGQTLYLADRSSIRKIVIQRAD